MDEAEIEKTFLEYGFKRDTKLDDDDAGKYVPVFGEKGEPIYRKGFSKHYDSMGGHTKFFFIKGRFDPGAEEYELVLKADKYGGGEHIQPLEDELSNLFGSYLENQVSDAIDEFKRSKNIPEEISIGTGTPVIQWNICIVSKGKNFKEVYEQFETTLKNLGYIDDKLPAKDQTMTSHIG